MPRHDTQPSPPVAGTSLENYRRTELFHKLVELARLLWAPIRWAVPLNASPLHRLVVFWRCALVGRTLRRLSLVRSLVLLDLQNPTSARKRNVKRPCHRYTTLTVVLRDISSSSSWFASYPKHATTPGTLHPAQGLTHLLKLVVVKYHALLLPPVVRVRALRVVVPPGSDSCRLK